MTPDTSDSPQGARNAEEQTGAEHTAAAEHTTAAANTATAQSTAAAESTAAGGGTSAAVPARGAAAGVSGEPPLVIGAALVTVLLWASAFVGIRAAGRALSPGALTLGRLFVGAVVLGVFVVARRAAMPPRADIPRLLVCGILWFGVYNLALNASEQRIDAGTASLIVSLGPILIALLAAVLLREGLPKPLVVGGAIAFAGAILIGLATTGHSSSAGVGSLLGLVATVTYAGGVVSQKPLLANTSALVVTWLACIVGLVICLPFAPQLIDQLADADASAIAWTVYLGALPTALAFTTWAYALARSTAGRMGAMTYLVAPFAVLMGWLFLGETPPWLALGGGLLCLGGVAFAQRRK
ncbi:membrane protein [Streptomyces sulfonofaciens]|uniref:Membrane protein n=1 Tax=Streptomyces sulfonofaciens TaxID=68272 RepID=A0A919GQJ7_9ACTN|nr:DMT family transporter [Streptomyces sulfonofaciens]GHH88231.1 membrane protein [Streptomyces sulfonofaciens]